jgi:hypothetical protein
LLSQYGRPLYGDVFGVQQPEPEFYEVWNRYFYLGDGSWRIQYKAKSYAHHSVHPSHPILIVCMIFVGC